MGQLGWSWNYGIWSPAAIGAQIGNPDQTVILFSGDGSIMMKIQELVTAVNNCLPLKIFVLNNNYLGMVRQWQECFLIVDIHQLILSTRPCQPGSSFWC